MSEKLTFTILGEDQFSGVFDKLKSHLPSVKQLALGAAAGVTALSGALLATAKTTATAYDKYQKFSDQTKLSTEFLSSYTVAANYAGISQDTLFKSIQKLTVGIGEASKDIGTAKDTFADLDIEIWNSNDKLKTAEELMPILADKFQNMTDSTMRLEMAQKLFGQRNTEMIQLLGLGSEAIADMTDKAELMGKVVSSQAAVNAALFNDTLSDSQDVILGLKNALGEQLIPYITGAAQKFNDFVINNRDQIIDFGKVFLTTVLNIAEKGAYAVGLLIDSWRGLQMVYETLKIGLSLMVESMLYGLNLLTEKVVAFVSKFNFGGVFDSTLEKIDGFNSGMESVLETMGETRQQWQENLEEIASQGYATEKIDEYVTKVRGSMDELAEIGTARIETQNQELITIEQNEALSDARRQKQLDKKIKLEEKLLKESLKKKEQWDKNRAERKKKREEELAEQEKAIEQSKEDALYAIQQLGGKKGFALVKSIKIAETTIDTYKAAQAAFSALAGIPIIGPALGAAAAAVAIIAGLARVSQIKGQTYAAHGGYTNVPKEQTMLLDKGERILSPSQNQDLTNFLNNQGGAGGGIENMNISIFPNATNAEALLYMDKSDWINIVETNIIPAMKTLSNRGIAV